MLILLGLGALGYWVWRTVQRHRQRDRRRQARLNKQFYQLIKRRQGRISALEFAMYTRIDGIAAQDYLNQQAQAFSAYCETTPQGDIVYVFNQAAIGQSMYAAQLEAAWAWEEYAQAQRAHFEHRKAAWISAKQLNALRRMTQTALDDVPIVPLPEDQRESERLRWDGQKLPDTKFQGILKSASTQLPACRLEEAEKKGVGRTSSAESHPNAKTSPQANIQPDEKEIVTIEVKAVRG